MDVEQHGFFLGRKNRLVNPAAPLAPEANNIITKQKAMDGEDP